MRSVSVALAAVGRGSMRSKWSMREAVVWAAGVVGLSIVMRAAALYRSSDRLAFALVGLIGAGLVLGIAELVARARRAQAVEREVEALPAEPTEASIDAASPAVRAVLRARVAGVPAPAVASPFASYLIGLLVMLGLLGTFLGLFESLKGAREALGASGDVTALRAALAAPIAGLSRAFGTSAAGVSASAMLGLALVAVRRMESEASAVLARYVAGPLAPLTVSRRTLAALEMLARQGDALPEASAAITRSAVTLGDVAREVKGATEATNGALREELRALSGGLREDVRGLTGAVHVDLTGVAKSVREELSGVAKSVRDDLRGTAQSVRDELGGVASGMRSDLEATTLGMRDAMQTLSASLRDDLRGTLTSIREDLQAASKGSAQAVAEAVAPRLEDAVAAIAAAGETSAASLVRSVEAASEARLARETEQATALRASVEQAIAAVVAAQRAESESLREAVAREAKSLLDTVVEGRELLVAAEADRADRIAAALRDTAGAIAERFEATARSDQEREARLDVLLGKLDTLASTVEAHGAAADERSAAADARSAAADARVSALEGTLSQAYDRATRTLAEGLAEHQQTLGAALAAEQRAMMEAATAQMQSMADRTATQMQSMAEETATQLQLHAEATGTRLTQFVEQLEAIRKELRADDDERSQRVTARMEQQLDALAKTLADSLAASLDGVVRSAQAAPEAAARVIDDAAARLRAEAEADSAREERLATLVERIDGLAARIDAQTTAQAERLGILESKLEESYATTADAWTERLAAHQLAIEEGVRQTSTAMREAAEAVSKGGTELGSTATLFGGSVDRYREASEKWLMGLSAMRAAAERAAQADSHDLLAAYLEQTREVFDQSLQFQRQLFAELRRVANTPRLGPGRPEEVEVEVEA